MNLLLVEGGFFLLCPSFRASIIWGSIYCSRYYNEDGSRTEEWHKVQALLSQREALEAERKELEKRFPGCNSRWDKKEGGYVFCSEKRSVSLF